MENENVGFRGARGVVQGKAALPQGKAALPRTVFKEVGNQVSMQTGILGTKIPVATTQVKEATTKTTISHSVISNSTISNSKIANSTVRTVGDSTLLQPGVSHTGNSHTGIFNTGVSHIGNSHMGNSHMGNSHTGNSHTGNVQTGVGNKQALYVYSKATAQSRAAALPKEDASLKVLPKKDAKEVKVVCRLESIINHKALGQIIAKPKPTSEIAHSSKKLLEIFNVDEKDMDDPLLVSAYVLEKFEYLRVMEKKYPIRKAFLGGHRSTPRMRSVLVNWMVEVHVNFKFLQETLPLSVAILDRYLQVMPSIGKETLQLVGTTSILIAGKFEEMYVPDLDVFVYICKDTYSSKQILAMEADILRKLQFNLGIPLALHFLRRYSKVACVKLEQHTLGKYLLEVGLLEYELCHIQPSLQAAAACCLAMSILEDVEDPSKVWSTTLEHYSTYKYSAIKGTIADFAACLSRQELSKYQAIRKKYAALDYGKISANPKLNGDLVKRLSQSSSCASVQKKSK